MGDEIELISNLDRFKKPAIMVSANDLGFKDGNMFNELIAGWAFYWNDIYKPDTPIHPNLVKALIATESSFDPKVQASNGEPGIGQAQGLVQLTEQTYKILKNRKGELKDHLVILNTDEIWLPNNNICAAIRWLFRKHETAKKRLKREPTWEETLWEYKGILNKKNPKSIAIKKRLAKFIERMHE